MWCSSGCTGPRGVRIPNACSMFCAGAMRARLRALVGSRANRQCLWRAAWGVVAAIAYGDPVLYRKPNLARVDLPITVSLWRYAERR